MMEKVRLFSQILSIVIWIYPAWKLFSLYFRYFIRYMFCMPQYEWKKEIERPRLLFVLVGVIFVLFSQLLFYAGTSIVFLSISSLLNATGMFVLYFVWTKEFEQRFIKRVKAKLLGNTVRSIYAEGYDIEAILNRLNFIKCEAETFKDFLSGNRIPETSRINCSLDKKKLLRFIFIIFCFRTDVEHSVVKNIVQHYYINQDGKSYLIQDKASEISGVISEMLQEDKKYILFRDEIVSVFQSHKKTEL